MLDAETVIRWYERFCGEHDELLLESEYPSEICKKFTCDECPLGIGVCNPEYERVKCRDIFNVLKNYIEQSQSPLKEIPRNEITRLIMGQ